MIQVLSVQRLPVLLAEQETNKRINYALLGHAMVRRRLRNPQARIWSKDRQYVAQDFLQPFPFPLSVSFHKCSKFTLTSAGLEKLGVFKQHAL